MNNRALYVIVFRKVGSNYNDYIRENPLGHTFEFFKDGKLVATRSQNFVELTAPGVYKTRVDGNIYSPEL